MKSSLEEITSSLWITDVINGKPYGHFRKQIEQMNFSFTIFFYSTEVVKD